MNPLDRMGEGSGSRALFPPPYRVEVKGKGRCFCREVPDRCLERV